MVDAEQRACGVELPQLSLIVRIIRFQNAVPDIVAAGAAHGKDALSADLIELPPHQMQDTGTDRLHLSAVPFARRVVPQEVIVFVITVHKQGGKGPVRQPVQPLLFSVAAIPDTAKVPADDYIILFGQAFLFPEDLRAEAAEVAVRIACEKNCH